MHFTRRKIVCRVSYQFVKTITGQMRLLRTYLRYNVNFGIVNSILKYSVVEYKNIKILLL